MFSKTCPEKDSRGSEPRIGLIDKYGEKNSRWVKNLRGRKLTKERGGKGDFDQGAVKYERVAVNADGHLGETRRVREQSVAERGGECCTVIYRDYSLSATIFVMSRRSSTAARREISRPSLRDCPTDVSRNRPIGSIGSNRFTPGRNWKELGEILTRCVRHSARSTRFQHVFLSVLKKVYSMHIYICIF